MDFSGAEVNLLRVADSTQDVLEMLHDLAELTVLEEGDVQSFKVRAYESAARAVEGYVGDITKLTAKELEKIEGIGKSTAAKIRELLDSGQVQKLEGLRQKHPASVMAMMRIPGLGPKAVNRLRKELGVESVSDLRTAIADQKLRGMKGFGAKSEEKIAHSLERMDRAGGEGRSPISVALPLAERIVERLSKIQGVTDAHYCGSLRRFSETIGDIDILVASDDPGPVMDAVTKLNVVDSVIVKGDAKTSVVTKRGIQIDVRVVAKHQLGAALMYFTGSKAHNVKLRMRALARGMTLNEYALSMVEGGKVVAAENEEGIYRALGLPFIPPVQREDQGEIELADKGKLPASLDDRRVTGDFHVHTSVSGDGRSPLEDVVAAAKAAGRKVLAITDHAEGTVSGVGRDALLEQRAHIQALRKKCGDSIVLLHGVELNIGPNGELDYDLEFRKQFDWCLASVHDHFDMTRDEQTERILVAMRDPTVRMIGHLSARMIGARPPIDLDLDAIYAGAEETGTALEINGGLPRLDMSVEALRRGRDRNVVFMLTSDAHQVSELDRVLYARNNAHRAGVSPEKISNLWTGEKLATWVRDKPASKVF